ncbi:ALG6, ALG8 glycosyltransferase family-domain-containing protein [Jimgerdemannia flammicorona]|uniref:Alpha-1,3-glucosyltransferase n=1 Tax=Jimgerdemannia flammicorona TaxID=994334 RepID=A0A433DEV1_9FUNG|nr:ALG6, ALG8 glycosyltransferase family-domain-containing protein [Jimgerdemannia flammicorona]
MARTKNKRPSDPQSATRAKTVTARRALDRNLAMLRSPADRWFFFLEQSGIGGGALSLTLLFVMYVRWAVALNPYSGAATPPMFGDYEAQRHWMELTLHVPISQWYTHDLEWWGLDYPPLTAYISWLCGLIGSWINPAWFALDASHGYESANSKFYMRATVILFEGIVYIPAVIGFVNRWYAGQSAVKRNTATLLMLLQPALLIIDHGHFQYNAVMLGLTLLAINHFLSGTYVLGALFFCLSLAFKQMALYYSPAIFAYLLGKCFREPSGQLLFLRLGGVVIGTFSALLSPWLTSSAALLQVAHRVFPLARGLYEDKVANMWCAASVVIKLKEIFDVSTCMRLSNNTCLPPIVHQRLPATDAHATAIRSSQHLTRLLLVLVPGAREVDLVARAAHHAVARQRTALRAVAHKRRHYVSAPQARETLSPLLSSFLALELGRQLHAGRRPDTCQVPIVGLLRDHGGLARARALRFTAFAIPGPVHGGQCAVERQRVPCVPGVLQLPAASRGR